MFYFAKLVINFVITMDSCIFVTKINKKQRFQMPQISERGKNEVRIAYVLIKYLNNVGRIFYC